MDDHSRHGSQMLANVVRDFAGSRLERQLLARAFELAWHGSQVEIVLSRATGNVPPGGAAGLNTTASIATRLAVEV
jgi:hypothetical protein